MANATFYKPSFTVKTTEIAKTTEIIIENRRISKLKVSRVDFNIYKILRSFHDDRVRLTDESINQIIDRVDNIVIIELGRVVFWKLNGIEMTVIY